MKTVGWQLRGALGAISILILGGGLGILGYHLVIADELPAMTAPQDAHAVALQSMTDELGVDETQRAEIHTIFRRHQATVTKAWEELHWRIQNAVDSALAEIELTLDPLQRERLHAWLAAHREEAERHERIVR